MSVTRAVMAFAGTVVLLSVLMSQIHHPAWLWLTAFVGANLLQASFTGIAAHRTFSANIGDRGNAVNRDAVLVSGSYFPVLGVPPALGRNGGLTLPGIVLYSSKSNR